MPSFDFEGCKSAAHCRRRAKDGKISALDSSMINFKNSAALLVAGCFSVDVSSVSNLPVLVEVKFETHPGRGQRPTPKCGDTVRTYGRPSTVSISNDKHFFGVLK